MEKSSSGFDDVEEKMDTMPGCELDENIMAAIVTSVSALFGARQVRCTRNRAQAHSVAYGPQFGLSLFLPDTTGRRPFLYLCLGIQP